MELPCNGKELSQRDNLVKNHKDHVIIISSNWHIDNNKTFEECVSTVSLSLAPERTDLEDVVSLDTCIALKSDCSEESCRVEFKIVNKQRIARIALVSEASVLEFFKQSGEYATTVFADFVDEFQDHAVYFAEAKIEPPSTEASIKFTRTKKSKGSIMWIYGIKLILTAAETESSNNTFNLDIINSYLCDSDHAIKSELARKVFQSFSSRPHFMGEDMNQCLQKLATMDLGSQNCQKNSEKGKADQSLSAGDKVTNNGDFTTQDTHNLKAYLDDKFADMEKRLMERMELMEQKMNLKFDTILKLLDKDVDKQ